MELIYDSLKESYQEDIEEKDQQFDEFKYKINRNKI